MALPAWYWPPSGLTARTLALVPWGSGIAAPDWYKRQFFPFSGGIGFGAPVVLGGGPFGFCDAAPDGAGGIWLSAYDGRFHYQPATGAAVSGTLAQNLVYIANAYTNGQLYTLASNGAVFTTGGTQIGAFPSGAPVAGLAGSGIMLVSMLPGSGLIGTMTTGGVTGSIALPAGMATPTCLAMLPGSGIIAGGYQTAPTLSGMAAAMLDPQNALNMLAVGSGHAIMWTAPGPFSENWQQSLILSGLANLNSLAWRSDGTQALATSAVSGSVQVIGFSANVLSLVQTLTISGAVSVALAGSLTNALVVQSGQSKLTPLAFTSTWATGTALTGAAVTGATQIAAWGATGAVLARSGGVTFLGLTAGTWGVISQVNLPYTPTVLTVDPFLRVFAAGSGQLSVLSGSTVVGSGSWSGAAPTSIAVQQGRVIMAVPSDSLFRIFAESTTSSYTQQGTLALNLGAVVGLGLSTTVLFAMGSGSTVTYGFSGMPFALTPVLSGNVGHWNGSSWASTVLGIGHIPSAINYDASGNTWVVTQQNTIFNIASSGTLLSSGALTVPAGQTQTTPVGGSSILAASGHLYVGTSLGGFMVETS